MTEFDKSARGGRLLKQKRIQSISLTKSLTAILHHHISSKTLEGDEKVRVIHISPSMR